jgi:hypothetical protein
MNEEMNARKENNPCNLTELPPEEKAVDNKWVFKVKRDESGDIARYKTRLMVKGYSQWKGFDYNETYAQLQV